LSFIGHIFNDSNTEEDKINQVLIQEAAYNGKITRYRVFGEPFSILGYNIWLYFFTFFLKFVASFMAKSILRKGKVDEEIAKKIKIIAVIKHFHFIIFNSVMIDGAFYSTRVIANIKNFQESGILVFIVSYLMMTFLILDLLEIFAAGLSLSKNSNLYHKDDIQELEKNFLSKMVKQPTARLNSKKVKKEIRM